MTVLKLEKKLELFIDEKLSGNTFAQQMIKEKVPRLVLVEAAKALIGIKEKTGKNDGEFIELIQETYGTHSREPYCIGGIMTCLAYTSLKTGIPHKVFETESSKQLFENTAKVQRVKKVPAPGALMIWGDVNTKGQWKGTGHGEIVISATENTIHCVGFNTSGTVSPNDKVNREGNGVYYTVRNYKDTKSRKLRGFLKPY